MIPYKDDLAVEQIRAGSTEALGIVYDRYAAQVYRVAYRLTASRQDAEDVVQDVFVGLPRALRAYREQGRFEAWLKRVAARTALMKNRSQRRRMEEPVESAAHSGVIAPDVISRMTVQRALQSMPDSLRSVWVLKEIEGFTHGEIAELLDISGAASAVRLSRAWSFLRREVSET
jgi:RNA polymerase sigma-70 factor (ECF subfamily)